MAAMISDRSWPLEVAADRVWAGLARTDRYPAWWPWLRRFEAPEGLVVGARWRCTVKPPLPYVVVLTLDIDEVQAPVRVDARVTGDVAGHARIDVTANGGEGCTLRLRSRLRPTRPTLIALGRVAAPLTRWGHDWVLATGMREFVAHATSET